MADNNQSGTTKPGAGWHGDKPGHQMAGAQSSGNKNAAANLTDADRSKGGKVAHEKGTAHEFSSAEARQAGSIGGSR